MKREIVSVILILFFHTTFAHSERWDENKEDWSPLMLAIYKGQTQKYINLITTGADVNYVTSGKKTGWRLTALEVAIRKENETAVEALLKTNRISKPRTFLLAACGQKSANNVNQLIKYGANPKDTLQDGYSVLMMAASFGSYEVFETLLKQGADPKQRRQVDGMTALMLAAFNGQIEKVRLLLNHGADKYAKDKNGETAFHYANQIYERMKVSKKTKLELKKLLE